MAKKPVVLLDVDGVVADFVGASLKRVAEAGGPHLDPSAISGWDFPELKGEWLDYLFTVWKEDDEFLLTLPTYPGAIDGVDMLSEIAQVVFVTASLGHTYQRLTWLHRHFNVPPKDVIFTQGKHHVVGDYFVDDYWDNVTGWQNANPLGHALLWTRPWNAAASGKYVRAVGADDMRWRTLYNIVKRGV